MIRRLPRSSGKPSGSPSARRWWRGWWGCRKSAYGATGRVFARLLTPSRLGATSLPSSRETWPARTTTLACGAGSIVAVSSSMAGRLPRNSAHRGLPMIPDRSGFAGLPTPSCRPRSRDRIPAYEPRSRGSPAPGRSSLLTARTGPRPRPGAGLTTGRRSGGPPGRLRGRGRAPECRRCGGRRPRRLRRSGRSG